MLGKRVTGPVVISEPQTNEELDEGEAIQAHNAGLLERYVDGLMRRKLNRYIGRPMTDELQRVFYNTALHVTRHLEQLGLLEPPWKVDVYQDPYDPTVVRIDVRDRWRAEKMFEDEYDDDFEQECPTDIAP
jgi:hypothetical protein